MKLLALVLALSAAHAQQAPQGFGARSSAAKDVAKPIEPGQATLDGFLGSRVKANVEGRLVAMDTEALVEPFRHRDGTHAYWEGEHVGKWLHAATLAWRQSGNKALKSKLDKVAAGLIATQDPDGYLGTYPRARRWGSWDVWVHKYNLIGLISYWQYTHDEKALRAARGIGDLLCSTFGPGKRDINRAGEHMGMAATSVLEPMVLLYRATGEKRYLDFAKWIVRNWDAPGGPAIIHSLLETHSVYRTANGKAYEMLSNLVGLCELYRATGDAAYLIPVKIAWQDVVSNRLEPTGTASSGEHFTPDHELPFSAPFNIGENCVAVTWLQLNLQLYRLTGDGRYMDEVEKTLYNHIAAAQRPDGAAWCYFTPLDGKREYLTNTNCCLSSGPRALALAPMFVCATRAIGVDVDLFEKGTYSVTTADGRKVHIGIETSYPFGEDVVLRITPDRAGRFALRFRVPGWCHEVHVGQRQASPDKSGYVTLDRAWRSGSTVSIHFAMPIVAVAGRDLAAGRTLVRRGPLVYAADSLMDGRSGTRLPSAAKPPFRSVEPPKGKTRFGGERWIDVSWEGGKTELRPFADAGSEGGACHVWLTKVEPDALIAEHESRSRHGNVEGSINDADPLGYVVTYDGKSEAEDWYEISFERPVSVNLVKFRHGKCFHDGGWFDASMGKPRVEVKATEAGAWEEAGPLGGYPDTTATDSKGLQPGDLLELRFPTRTVVAVRVVGRPACGDNSAQAFSSCGELTAFKASR